MDNLTDTQSVPQGRAFQIRLSYWAIPGTFATIEDFRAALTATEAPLNAVSLSDDFVSFDEIGYVTQTLTCTVRTGELTVGVIRGYLYAAIQQINSSRYIAMKSVSLGAVSSGDQMPVDTSINGAVNAAKNLIPTGATVQLVSLAVLAIAGVYLFSQVKRTA